MIDADILVELGFSETAHCENFWTKKKKAYKYETTNGENYYSLTVFESKDKVVVLNEVDKYQLKLEYDNIVDALDTLPSALTSGVLTRNSA